MTLDGSLNCRDYQRDDEHKILTLFKEVFSREMSLAFWRWRFVKTPFGEPIIKLMFDSDKLIGHYAVVPVDIQIQGKLLKAVFSMTTMTHADYSGRGIFSYLAEEAYQLCQRKGFHLVYGFPNENSYYGFTRKLGWIGLGKVTFLEKKLEKETLGQLNIKNIQRVTYFDTRINSLWEKIKQDYSIIVPRTKEFLAWRFVENPDTDYKKYIIVGDNREILGYVILKIYAKGNKVEGHIVDMLSIDSRDIVVGLLRASYQCFTNNGVESLTCWVPGDCLYNEVLQEEGFMESESNTYFGARVFDQDDKLLKKIGDINNWFLTMGDTDVF